MLLLEKKAINFELEINSPSIAILYDKSGVKITLYQSGRMLIETRDMEIAEKLVLEILEILQQF